MATSFLSPTAKSFEPVYEFAVFNNGVPSCVYYDDYWGQELLRNIPDETIDYKFPPNAEEVAEIEAAEEFVETMAWLSFLDECEEKFRTNFDGLKKRWATRREEGLVGKPHPVKQIHNEPRARSGTVVDPSETNLVPLMNVPRPYELSRPVNRNLSKKADSRIKKIKGVHGRSIQIQQPRKQN